MGECFLAGERSSQSGIVGTVKSVQKGFIDDPTFSNKYLSITIDTVNPDRTVAFISFGHYAASSSTKGPVVYSIEANTLKLYTASSNGSYISWTVIEFF